MKNDCFLCMDLEDLWYYNKVNLDQLTHKFLTDKFILIFMIINFNKLSMN